MGKGGRSGEERDRSERELEERSEGRGADSAHWSVVAWWCAITSVGVVKVEGEVLVVVGEERFAAVLVGGVEVGG